MEKIIEYAPILIVVIMFLNQHKIFVKPEQLEVKHREILADVSKLFATKESVDKLESGLQEITSKIDKKVDKIYDILLEVLQK